MRCLHMLGASPFILAWDVMSNIESPFFNCDYNYAVRHASVRKHPLKRLNAIITALKLLVNKQDNSFLITFIVWKCRV